MEAVYSSVDSLQFLNYALRVGFVDWEIFKSWEWLLMNMAVAVTVMWAFGVSRWIKHAQSHCTATAREESREDIIIASASVTDGSNSCKSDFSQGRIYIKCEGTLEEISPKQGSYLEEPEFSRCRNPILCSYSLSDNTFSKDKCMYSIIGMSCSRDNVISVWNNGVGNCVHDIKLDEDAITVDGNCFIQNSPKSVSLSSILWSGEEKSWLCLWDRRQPVKALSLSLEDEWASLHAVEFNDTKVCVSDGLHHKLFDLRKAASPVVEVYPMETPIRRQNQSDKTWNYLEGLVMENSAEFAFSERRNL